MVMGADAELGAQRFFYRAILRQGYTSLEVHSVKLCGYRHII